MALIKKTASYSQTNIDHVATEFLFVLQTPSFESCFFHFFTFYATFLCSSTCETSHFPINFLDIQRILPKLNFLAELILIKQFEKRDYQPLRWNQALSKYRESLSAQWYLLTHNKKIYMYKNTSTKRNWKFIDFVILDLSVGNAENVRVSTHAATIGFAIL